MIKEMRCIIFISALLFLVNTCYGQIDHKKAYQLVLKRGEVGKTISFDQTKGENYDSLVLKYLGDIKTKKGQHLKILTSRWYWGISKRGTSRIVVFNQKNQYLGDYYLSMTYEVPDKIEGTSLVFINKKESDCTPNVVTKVSFQNGIPRRFFLKCKGQYGDIYSFDQNL
jgi:hypothetical protein